MDEKLVGYFIGSFIKSIEKRKMEKNNTKNNTPFTYQSGGKVYTTKLMFVDDDGRVLGECKKDGTSYVSQILRLLLDKEEKRTKKES